MEKYCVVTVTVPDIESGEKLARLIVNARLAACVQVSMHPVKSFYWWDKQVKEQMEYTISIKTETDVFYKLKEIIVKNHPYTVPEILLIPVPCGLSSYFQWIDEEMTNL